MSLFQRSIRWLLSVIGFVAGLSAALAIFFSRQLIRPARQRLWATPADVGIPYQEIQFPARDGLRLSGWFVPARPQGNGITIVLAHGWPWNRLGSSGDDLLSQISASAPLNLLRLVHSLHQAGYQLLLFDLRNHGQSAEAPPVTFGLRESNDLLGALDYLGNRNDVNTRRIGVVGFSMGANAVLYSLPYTDAVRAAVLVQPTSVDHFARRYGADLLGPLSKLVLPMTEAIYRAFGGPQFTAIDPVAVAPAAGDTPILYVQGKGDQWGSVENVHQMARATPKAVAPLIVDTFHRFGGYQYVIDNPNIIDSFLQEQIT